MIRAAYLEREFYPELRTLLDLGLKKKFNLLKLRGSTAGAFGLPQFLPSSYVRFGYDGNGDGKVDLFNVADAIHSASNFLKGSGWSDDLPEAEKRKVIWKYNHSDAYIDTVLGIAAKLKA